MAFKLALPISPIIWIAQVLGKLQETLNTAFSLGVGLKVGQKTYTNIQTSANELSHCDTLYPEEEIIMKLGGILERETYYNNI